MKNLPRTDKFESVASNVSMWSADGNAEEKREEEASNSSSEGEQ